MNDGFSFSKEQVWERGGGVSSLTGFGVGEKDRHHDNHYCILTISDILY